MGRAKIKRNPLYPRPEGQEPTDGGDCYAVAGRIALSAPDDHLLCHGTVTGRGKVSGIPFGHAWIEVGDEVIDKSNGLNARVHRDAYYALGQVWDVTRYTPAEARRLMGLTRHFGPW